MGTWRAVFVAVTLSVFICCFLTPFGAVSQGSPGATEVAPTVIACRVLEAHASAQPAATVVVFHHKDKQDQATLASLLRQRSGTRAEVQVGGGEWTGATVFRLKSCFGRGLLILPANATAPKEGESFLLKFAPAGNAQ